MLGFSQYASPTQAPTANSSIIQSAKLLQFTREALETYLLEQQRNNPLIEIENTQQPGQAEVASGPDTTGLSAKSDPPMPMSYATGGGGGRSKGQGGDGLSRWEEHIPGTQTLTDHLLMQLGSGCKSKDEREIGYHLIQSIDEDGYLRSSLEMISLELDQPVAKIEATLEKIQQMDPPGVGARSLAECLKLQLRELGKLDAAFEQMLKSLPLLANHKIRELASLCKLPPAQIQQMARTIKSLNPRPGSKFASAPVISVVPDVYVTLREDGTFVTTLNDQALPRLLVNRQYYSEIRKSSRSASDIKFVTDCMRDANMLVRGLEQRAQTILKVASEIVLHQRDFLLKGPGHLKPLVLREIADRIGVHPSTVSRATANKYIMTSAGMFDLKYFFNNSVSSEGDGETMAANVVKHKIRQLIQGESPDKVLADDDIVRDLASDGIQLARRTVAKYRESMDIFSSHQRRRMKLAARDHA